MGTERTWLDCYLTHFYRRWFGLVEETRDIGYQLINIWTCTGVKFRELRLWIGEICVREEVYTQEEHE